MAKQKASISWRFKTGQNLRALNSQQGDLHLTAILSQHLLCVNSKHRFLTKTKRYTACIIPPLGSGKERTNYMWQMLATSLNTLLKGIQDTSERCSAMLRSTWTSSEWETWHRNPGRTQYYYYGYPTTGSQRSSFRADICFHSGHALCHGDGGFDSMNVGYASSTKSSCSQALFGIKSRFSERLRHLRWGVYFCARCVSSHYTQRSWIIIYMM